MNTAGLARACAQGKRLGVGPVFITDRVQPQHVLLSIEEYQRLIGGRRIVDVLAMPECATIEFDPPKAAIMMRPADFD
jgi:hypothetical protein